MADVFEEVNEDLRQEKVDQFWKEYGGWIIAAAVLAVIFTAAINVYRDWEVSKNIEQTSTMIEVIESQDAGSLSGYADQADKNHAILAKLTAAGMYKEQGKMAEAVTLYQNILQTPRLDPVYRGLADLMMVSIGLDTEDPAELHKSLSRLTDEKSSWRYSALELEALLYAREQNYTQAIASLNQILSEEQSPPAIQARAETLSTLYQVQNGKQPIKTQPIKTKNNN